MDNAPILFALNMAAAAALLIWAVRLVRTGFERACGGALRLWLRRSTANRASAAACGGIAAVLMQSSTAVAVLMAGFVSTGTIDSLAGIAIILGADLGSAVVALILNSDLSALMPLLLLSGVLLFLRSPRRQMRQIGRILIGFALIFLSLDLIRASSLPLVEGEVARNAMLYLADDPITAFFLAAIFAWLVHSSVAAVLLIATLADQSLLPGQAALAMVLGANLGGSFIAFVLTLKADAAVRRVVWSNLVLRGGGAALALALISQPMFSADMLGNGPGQQALHLHLAFNFALLVLCLPLVGPIMRLAELIIPEAAPDPGADIRRSALDMSVQNQPRRAFACAVREMVEIGDRVEVMLRQSIPLFDRYEEAQGRAMRNELEGIVKLSLDLRIYLAGVRTGDGDAEIGARGFELSGMAVNLEAAADMIAGKMVDLAQSKSMNNLSFSDEGWRELVDFHDTVLRNVQLGITVLMSEDVGLARELVEQKESVRAAAQRLERTHLERLQKGLTESIDTSAIHLDVVRSLKEVNSSFAMIAYPLLKKNGTLLESRLAGA
jgi:phosphate:Na+ symporter